MNSYTPEAALLPWGTFVTRRWWTSCVILSIELIIVTHNDHYSGGCVYDESNVQSLRNAYASGHQIASHTWSHARLTTLSGGARKFSQTSQVWSPHVLMSFTLVSSEFSRVNDAVQKILGVYPAMMRPVSRVRICNKSSWCQSDLYSRTAHATALRRLQWWGHQCSRCSGTIRHHLGLWVCSTSDLGSSRPWLCYPILQFRWHHRKLSRTNQCYVRQYNCKSSQHHPHLESRSRWEHCVRTPHFHFSFFITHILQAQCPPACSWGTHKRWIQARDSSRVPWCRCLQ